MRTVFPYFGATVRFFAFAVRVFPKTRGQIHIKKGTFVRSTNVPDCVVNEIDSYSSLR